MFKKERGSILITALAVMAITAAIATSLLLHQAVEIKKTELILIQDKLLAHVSAIDAWGLGQIKNSAKKDKNYPSDDLTQPWATPLAPYEADGVLLSGKIIDLQGFFNVNTLVMPKRQKPETGAPGADKLSKTYSPPIIFKRIIDNLPDYAEGEWPPAETIAQSIQEWISDVPAASDEVYIQGEDGYAYRPGKRPFFSISELRLVQSMVPSLMEALLTVMIALPIQEEERVTSGEKPAVSYTKINVNTASPRVIAAVLNIGLDEAMQIVAARPFKNRQMLEEILQSFSQEKEFNLAAKTWLDIQTEYFMIESKASWMGYEGTWYTVAYRSPEKNVEILYRMRGVY